MNMIDLFSNIKGVFKPNSYPIRVLKKHTLDLYKEDYIDGAIWRIQCQSLGINPNKVDHIAVVVTKEYGKAHTLHDEVTAFYNNEVVSDYDATHRNIYGD
jgi:hypothetical protein